MFRYQLDVMAVMENCPIVGATRKKNKKVFLKDIALFSIIGISIFSCVRTQLCLPDGWRRPTQFDVGTDDWRKEDPEGFLLSKGDFNGDGIVDVAKLLVREDGLGVGLWVFVSENKEHMFKQYLLDEKTDKQLTHRLGITKVSPGVYLTTCGKGYAECGEDEVPEALILHDAIDYFLVDSAHSYFYWDSKAETFKMISISD